MSPTALRAAVIIGAGGASFELLRHLVERLPVMIAPRWIDTRCQPIAVDDVIGYLVGCLRTPATAGLSLDIGGPEITTYRGMMLTYARVRGLRRLIIPVPVLTPRLSAHWINLITPVPAGVVYPLVEGLKNEVVCRDNRIRDLVPIELTPMNAAICAALTGDRGGAGEAPVPAGLLPGPLAARGASLRLRLEVREELPRQPPEAPRREERPGERDRRPRQFLDAVAARAALLSPRNGTSGVRARPSARQPRAGAPGPRRVPRARRRGR